MTLLGAGHAGGAATSSDAGPVIWYEDDRADIPPPRERDPNLLWDGVNETFMRPAGRLTHPGRLVRGVGALFGGDPVPPAQNVNVLDEVPNSSWFTNRIGLRAFSPEEAARGPGEGTGPVRDGASWVVIGAKSAGVTPGFTVRDGRGDVYFVKLEARGLANVSSAAAVIAGRILHAAGYNVPDDAIITFRREDLVVGEGVRFTAPDGRKLPMTTEDLEAILRRVERNPDGVWRAIASRRLAGTPVGPFDYEGRREDDPNDRIDHEDRRELRGLYVFASWINHFDTKQHNSLDMYVTEGERRYVRHYLIDFASTLGAAANDIAPRLGWEYTVDLAALVRLGALGLYEDPWRRMRRPEDLPEIGYFESAIYEPGAFKPLEPNSAFANLTDRDGYWAAKIITAFTDAHLHAIAETGRYRDPRAAAYMARVLGERRDKIGRHWFDRVAPLDFFAVRGGRVQWRDLGEERGLYPGTTPRYRVRSAAVEGSAALQWTAWVESNTPSFEFQEGGAFRALECQVDRGDGWSSTVRAMLDPARDRVTAIER